MVLHNELNDDCYYYFYVGIDPYNLLKKFAKYNILLLFSEKVRKIL